MSCMYSCTLQEQYQFAYEAVQEALLCGDTGILVTNLRQGFSDLQSPDSKNKGKSKLETQFEVRTVSLLLVILVSYILLTTK